MINEIPNFNKDYASSKKLIAWRKASVNPSQGKFCTCSKTDSDLGICDNWQSVAMLKITGPWGQPTGCLFDIDDTRESDGETKGGPDWEKNFLYADCKGRCTI